MSDAPAPPAGQIPDDEPPGPWTHGFAEGAGGVRLHYVEMRPERPPSGRDEVPLVVLLHGFPEFWWSWREQIAPLAAAGYRVVAPDLRGYNLSDKPGEIADYAIERLVEDLRLLIAHCKRERAAVVGHDWGGQVAWQFAMDHPARTERVIVLNSPHPQRMQQAFSGRPSLRQLRRSWYMFAFQAPRLPERWLATNDYERVGLIFRDTAAHREAFPPDVLQRFRVAAARPGAMTAAIHYYRAAVRSGSRDALRQLRSAAPAALQPVLARAFGDAEPAEPRVWPSISAPALLVWGERDTALGRELTEGMEPLFSGPFELVYLPDCAHWVQQECPEDVNRLLLDFLARYADG